VTVPGKATYYPGNRPVGQHSIAGRADIHHIKVMALGDALACFLLALIALKLAGVVNWSWWWVLAPMWGSGLLMAAVLALLIRDVRGAGSARH
jgi:hypothetical protein